MENLFSVFNKLPRGKIIQLIRCQLCPNQGEQFFLSNFISKSALS